MSPVAGPLAIKDIWRVLKDVDLDAIRGQANAPFEVLIVSEDGRDAEALAWTMSADVPAPPPHERGSSAPDRTGEAVIDDIHPWLHVINARAGVPASLPSPEVAIVVSRTITLPHATEAVRDHLTRHRIPALTVIVGSHSSAATVTHRSEMRRIAIEHIHASALAALAEALIASARVEARLALARGFPWARSAVFLAIVDETARANASYALTTGLAETMVVLSAPIAIGDMLVLTKNQLLMAYRIALGSGRDGEPKALLGEILGVLGGGLLFRQAARSLVGLIPVVGLIPKVAVAYGGTYAIGRAMMAWTTEGRAVTADAVRKYSSEGLERGRRIARSLTAQSKRTEGVGTRVRNWISRKPPQA
jgi:uncharacterized protein (DUF697 family)